MDYIAALFFYVTGVSLLLTPSFIVQPPGEQAPHFRAERGARVEHRYALNADVHVNTLLPPVGRPEVAAIRTGMGGVCGAIPLTLSAPDDDLHVRLHHFMFDWNN